ncbi:MULTISPECIES: hypothetical protein [Providencia]|uniref:Uncharacterized protein n=1 Tax=Providencia stuartii TaxID=588 RepID=A0ABD5L193_PROST|nr:MULTISPECIES: hypothetical protein [Providencia]ELR5045913.1 hypothetical protein [Providencia rettgeri]ELR5290706.1 hypothetical protein [Providencia stuartii]MCR4179220.1 hypothetical protein [Providencia vermicola]URE80384.1 hypothetical protein MWH14_08915 [Providencia stuartii]
MKLQLIELPIFVTVILISMFLMGKNFSPSKKMLMPTLSFNQLAENTHTRNGIENERIKDEFKKNLKPIKEIKAFIRQKIY